MIRAGIKNKFEANLGYKEIFKFYSSNSNKPLNKVTYNKIFTEIFENIMNTVIEDGFNLQFPNKFGNLEIQKRKQKIVYNEDGTINRICFKVDWNATKKHWNTIYGDIPFEDLKEIKNKPKIYCKNKYRMSFKYLKSNAHYKGKSVVMFIPSRKWCRKLANHLKTNPYKTDYKEQ